MKIRFVICALMALCTPLIADAKKVQLDYSVINVPEEGGVKFEKITDDADCVNSQGLVAKGSGLFGVKNMWKIDWWVNPRIALSPDGNTILFHRGEGRGNYSIWSFDRNKNLFSSYSRGMTPCLLPGQEDVIN